MLLGYTATMLDLLAPLVVSNTTKIVLLSLDGLAGLPHLKTGQSEMETASLPNLDALATEAACGLLRHVAPGITPGSGPGHLGLFGYDPLRYPVGRGVLEALGIEFDLRAGDVAARGNFCTVDAAGRITDRRARRLTDAAPANMVLLRGFDQLPALPRFPEIFGLRAAAIAAYPMYRGLAKLVGMEVLKTGSGFADEVATLRQHWEGYDYFFVHYKDTDKAGEDGDFDAKVSALERFDAFVPEIRALSPDVIVVSGDHASPSVLASHGWQPVPVLLWSRYCGADPVKAFSERACAAGTLGVMPAQHLMPLVMANALRLTKYGA